MSETSETAESASPIAFASLLCFTQQLVNQPLRKSLTF